MFNYDFRYHHHFSNTSEAASSVNSNWIDKILYNTANISKRKRVLCDKY